LPEPGLRAGGSHGEHGYEGTAERNEPPTRGRTSAARVTIGDLTGRVKISSAI
jgi:hypothetical protein